MAIAFSLPSDECTLEHYRRIQQLLLDLINLIRTLINSDTPLIPSPSPSSSSVPASGSHFGFPTPPSSVPNSPSPFSPNATSATPAFVLPDVITSAATIEELRNLLISRSSSSVGPTAAPAAPTFGPVPPSVLRPTQEVNESQRIPIVVDPVQMQSSAPPNAKLRKRKRSRVSRKKKYCFECVHENDPMAMEVSPPSPSPSSPQPLSLAGHSERYHRNSKATTFFKCSCYDMTNFESFPNTHSRRDRHHTCNHVPSAADSEFYKDAAYYRRIAAAAAASTNATAGECKASEYWMNVGEELFRSPNKKDDKISDENKSFNGIISHCGRTVFAAALLVLGWKLLK